VAEYEAALDECQENHDDIDLNIAKAQEDLDQSGETSARRALARLKLVESLQIYCIYICVWITPMLIGIVLWWTLHPDFAQ
jgi:t-SNARE complex subunit (syntaxin)